jgi:hypothetical protein
MSDGLISIKDRKNHDKRAGMKDSLEERRHKGKFNPYKYVSPNLVKSSPVKKNEKNDYDFRLLDMILDKSCSCFLSHLKNDHIINHQTKLHLKKYDKHLKKFNSTAALDAALDVGFSEIEFLF